MHCKPRKTKSEQHTVIVRVTFRGVIAWGVVWAFEDFPRLVVECPLKVTTTDTVSSFLDLMLCIVLWTVVPEGHRTVAEDIDEASLLATIPHPLYSRNRCFGMSTLLAFHRDRDGANGGSTSGGVGTDLVLLLTRLTPPLSPLHLAYSGLNCRIYG